jgi:hypothetical protein
LGDANQLLDKQNNSRMLRKNPFPDVEAVSRRSNFFGGNDSQCALVDLGTGQKSEGSAEIPPIGRGGKPLGFAHPRLRQYRA